MFYNAKSKLEDTIIIFENLKNSKDSLTFKALFNSFLNSARAITYALQKDGKKIKGFSTWYEIKQTEMKNDPLLRFIHKARTEDFHEGKHRLNFSTSIKYFSSDLAGSPPSPNARIVIGGEGPFWIENEGTDKERRILIQQGGKYTIRISIDNPPMKHKDMLLFDTSPINLTRLTIKYFTDLLDEAMQKFEN